MARDARPHSLAFVVAVVCLLAAYSGEGSAAPPDHPQGATKAVRVIAAPAGLIAGAEPQPSGTLWLLAGSPTSKNLRLLGLNGATAATIVPVSAGAVDVVESSSSLLALGVATSTTGSLELRNGADGALVATVALPGPVQALAVGSDGATFYVLDGTSSVRTVSVVSSLRNRVTNSIPVPADTVSIAVDPSQKRLFALESDGNIKIIATGGGRILSEFLAGTGARRLAISNDGTTLYVLKTAGRADNVGSINVATQRQTHAIPAPANTVDIQVSLDASQLYDMVGAQRYGNVQLFALGR